MRRIIRGSLESQRYIRFITHDPAIMSRLNEEQISRIHHDDAAVIIAAAAHPGDYHSHMRNIAAGLPEGLADMNRPFPSWTVASATKRDAANVNQFESTLVERRT